MFMFQYNSITFYDNTPVEDTVFLDASLQGLGGVFKIRSIVSLYKDVLNITLLFT